MLLEESGAYLLGLFGSLGTWTGRFRSVGAFVGFVNSGLSALVTAAAIGRSKRAGSFS